MGASVGDIIGGLFGVMLGVLMNSGGLRFMSMPIGASEGLELSVCNGGAVGGFRSM
jgi:hypothetical protein